MCDHCSNCCDENDSGSGFLFGLIIGAVIAAVVAVVLYHQDRDKIFRQLKTWLEKLVSSFTKQSSPFKFKTIRPSPSTLPRAKKTPPKRFRK